MENGLEFVVRHGYVVLFAMALAEQLGLPIPAIPVLLATGALVARGRLDLSAALAVAVVASVLGDLVWYVLGRVRGGAVLNLLCRISLEPDSCVRRTEEVFARHGVRSLLFAKFVPGLSTAAPPLAGMFRMRPLRFLAHDAAGSLLWVSAYVGLGWIFADQLETVAAAALGLGRWLVLLTAAGLGLYLLRKYVQRRRFFRTLRVARITPVELKARIDSGEPVVVVDLRSSPDFEAERETIPGAIRADPTEIAATHSGIPRDRDVVLFCT